MHTTPDALSSTPAAPLSTEDFDTLDRLLADMGERVDEVPQWEFCEGFMAALICCRRPIPADEYFGALFGGDEQGHFGPALFGSEEVLRQFLDLWFRRWNELVDALDAPIESLDDPRAYAPQVMDVRGAVASLDEAEREQLLSSTASGLLPSFAQVWALGFMFAVETWPEEWDTPRKSADAEPWQAALEALVALTEDDEDEATLSPLGADMPPSVSAERLNAYGEALWAVYDLRDLSRSLGPRIETVRREPVPGRNDPCPCGSGRKYKKCCGAS